MVNVSALSGLSNFLSTGGRKDIGIAAQDVLQMLA